MGFSYLLPSSYSQFPHNNGLKVYFHTQLALQYIAKNIRDQAVGWEMFFILNFIVAIEFNKHILITPVCMGKCYYMNFREGLTTFWI